MTKLSAELLYDGKAELAEGSDWHEGALRWVDIFAGTFDRPAWEGNNRAGRDAEPLAGGIFVAQPGVSGKAPTLTKLDPQGS